MLFLAPFTAVAVASALLVDKKFSKIYLATDRNIPAAKFYEKNGFSQDENMGFYCKGV